VLDHVLTLSGLLLPGLRPVSWSPATRSPETLTALPLVDRMPRLP